MLGHFGGFGERGSCMGTADATVRGAGEVFGLFGLCLGRSWSWRVLFGCFCLRNPGRNRGQRHSFKLDGQMIFDVKDVQIPSPFWQLCYSS